MNNTFVLGIFLALVRFRSLDWDYSAETISILVVQLVMALLSFKRIQTARTAAVVAALYPTSVLLVFLLRKAF